MRDLCPECEEFVEVEKVRKPLEVFIRGENFKTLAEYYRCLVCGCEYEKSNAAFDPIAEAYASYRSKHNMLTADDIKNFRGKYGLTQSELARLLGWGGATISRYENGALQDFAHDRALRLVIEPAGLKELIEHDTEVLSPEKRQSILSRISKEGKRASLTECLNTITMYKPGILSGYKRMNVRKLFGVIEFLCNDPKGVPKTKLNKLLFYADFKHYKEQGVSITGARYAHLPYGPVLNNYDYFFAALIHEEQLIRVEEKSFDKGYQGEYYFTVNTRDLTELSDTELKTLLGIKELFNDKTAKDMADLSHEEEAYKQTSESKLISYQYAGQLSI